MNEVARGSPDIEGDLGRLTPAPVPPGLRGRVMERAAQTRRNTRLLTPRLRIAAVACSVLIVVVLGGEPLLGKLEAMQIAALASIVGPGSPGSGDDDDGSIRAGGLDGYRRGGGGGLADKVPGEVHPLRSAARRFGEDLKGLKRMAGI